MDLVNDGAGLGFGIVGGAPAGVVVRTLLPGGVAHRVSVQPSSWQQHPPNASRDLIGSLLAQSGRTPPDR